VGWIGWKRAEAAATTEGAHRKPVFSGTSGAQPPKSFDDLEDGPEDLSEPNPLLDLEIRAGDGQAGSFWFDGEW